MCCVRVFSLVCVSRISVYAGGFQGHGGLCCALGCDVSFAQCVCVSLGVARFLWGEGFDCAILCDW